VIRTVMLCGLLLTLAAPCRAGSFSVRVTTPSGTAVEDAAVVLEPLAGAVPVRHRAASIKQQDREFWPYLTVVQTGTAIEFPNHDPLKHHVYSFSPPKVFEIKLYAGKPAQPVLFDKPGIVALGCNIHDWMEAYVLVVNTPYFAKTTSGGHAGINGVPAGRYQLHLWHPRQKTAPQDAELEIGGGTLVKNLVLDVAPRMVKPKPPLDAESY